MFKHTRVSYGLKKIPWAWYERLSKFFLENDFKRRQIDTILFIKSHDKDILLVQIYVDDIIFGSTNESLYNEFAKLIQGEFEMSIMRELKYFLGLQIRQEDEEIFTP